MGRRRYRIAHLITSVVVYVVVVVSSVVVTYAADSSYTHKSTLQAPSLPFRGVIGYYDGTAPVASYDVVPSVDPYPHPGFGLQYWNANDLSSTYVPLGVDHMICGGHIEASFDRLKVTFVDYRSLGYVIFQVPWGDDAYPMFISDPPGWLPPPTVLGARVSGTDGHHYGFHYIPEEPACSAHKTYVVDGITGKLITCGWNRLGPILVNFDESYEPSSSIKDPEFLVTNLPEVYDDSCDRFLDLRDLPHNTTGDSAE
ncbi:MAG: hypothetical protein OXI96_06210 [Acidimicrobiaceae bacterium]|nr:hypothetical protein [Acidimicrobiaceae bacterium]